GGVGGRVGRAGTRGDVRGIVARHVGDDERPDRRPGGGGETTAVDRREMLAHGVHLLDRGPASQQIARDGLELFHGDLGRGKRQQARAAPREQSEEKVVFLQIAYPGEDFAGGRFARLVRDGVARLDHADLPRRQAVTVASDGNAVELAAVALFDCERHGGGRLACGGDERAAARRRRQVRRENLQRVGRRDRGAEARLEQTSHQAGAKSSFAASGPRLKYFG